MSGYVPVRLCDVLPNVRLAAARRVARTLTDHDAKVEVLAAAFMPSDRTYWLPEDRRTMVEALTQAPSDVSSDS